MRHNITDALTRFVSRLFEIMVSDWSGLVVRQQREGLGWEGHTLETLRNCFVKAVEATLETRDFPPSPNKSKETSASIPKAHKGGATSDEQTQRPPELSRDEGVGGGESNANAGEATRQPADKSPLCSSISSTRATVDLHYADSDLVGSWEVRLVQDGLNDSLVTRSVEMRGLSCTHALESRAVAQGGRSARMFPISSARGLRF